MNVEYTDGSNKIISAKDIESLAKKLKEEMNEPTFKSATVYKDIELPVGVSNNRANRRKYLYTNNPKHTDKKRADALISAERRTK